MSRAPLAAGVIAVCVAIAACHRGEVDTRPGGAAPCVDDAAVIDAGDPGAPDGSAGNDAGADVVADDSPLDGSSVVDTLPEALDFDADSVVCGATPLPIQSCGVDVCHVVVRLDYETRVVIDYVASCEAPHAPLRTTDLATMVQATFGLDAPPEATMSGFDLALWHAPSGAPAAVDGGAGLSAGAFMFVDHSTSSLIVGGTVDTTFKGGALLFPIAPRWTPRSDKWRPSCKPSRIPTAVPVYPAEGPAFGAYLAAEVADAAWNNAIGWSYEQAYRGSSSGFTAAAYRYAPTYKGTFRDWIVVVKLGTVPCVP